VIIPISRSHDAEPRIQGSSARHWSACGLATKQKFQDLVYNRTEAQRHNLRFLCLSQTTCDQGMDSALLRRPLIGLISSRPQCLFCLTSVQRRHQATSRRTRSHLKIQPDSSFFKNKSSPNEDHIIFNPPSSAPSVLHTPSIFLPKEDKRKKLLESISARTYPTQLPPVIEKFKDMGVKHHLTDAEIAEIYKLRSADPFTWTAAKLAKKFNCSAFFVRMCCEASEEVKEQERQKIEAGRAKWGARKKRAFEDRVKRKELALRDS
jgi:hypothetical protein